MGVSYNPSIVTSGLIMCLDAANLRSYPGVGTTWFDLTINSINGQLTNGVGYSGNNRGNLIFDGIDDFVDCGNSSILDVGNNITVNFWFMINTTTSYQVFVAKMLSNFSLGWAIAYSSGVFRTTLRPSESIIDLRSGNIAINNWYMGTMTFDTVTARLYLNGIQTGSTNAGGPVTLNSSQSLTIGKSVSGDNLNGNIAQLLIYNRALNATEIQQNFFATRSRYGV